MYSLHSCSSCFVAGYKIHADHISGIILCGDGYGNIMIERLCNIVITFAIYRSSAYGSYSPSVLRSYIESVHFAVRHIIRIIILISDA